MAIKTKTKERDNWKHRENTPVLWTAGQKSVWYLKGYLEFCMVFQNVYLFIPQFLTECKGSTELWFQGILVGKQWILVSICFMSTYTITAFVYLKNLNGWQSQPQQVPQNFLQFLKSYWCNCILRSISVKLRILAIYQYLITYRWSHTKCFSFTEISPVPWCRGIAHSLIHGATSNHKHKQSLKPLHHWIEKLSIF